jgi:hypothetical protein
MEALIWYDEIQDTLQYTVPLVCGEAKFSLAFVTFLSVAVDQYRKINFTACGALSPFLLLLVSTELMLHLASCSRPERIQGPGEPTAQSQKGGEGVTQ